MNKHTPGPWRVEFHDTGQYTAHIQGEYPNKTIRTIAVILPYAGEGESRANANLIASAPELLEACKEAERYLRFNKGNGSVAYDKVAQAIAKAERGN